MKHECHRVSLRQRSRIFYRMWPDARIRFGSGRDAIEGSPTDFDDIRSIGRNPGVGIRHSAVPRLLWCSHYGFRRVVNGTESEPVGSDQL